MLCLTTISVPGETLGLKPPAPPPQFQISPFWHFSVTKPPPLQHTHALTPTSKKIILGNNPHHIPFSTFSLYVYPIRLDFAICRRWFTPSSSDRTGSDSWCLELSRFWGNWACCWTWKFENFTKSCYFTHKIYLLKLIDLLGILF